MRQMLKTVRWRLCRTAYLMMSTLLVLELVQHNGAMGQDKSKEQLNPSRAQSKQIDPKVTGLLRNACDTLTAAKTISFTAVDTYERAARNGQSLY